MRLQTVDARTRFESARVARLATVREDGWPHLVPIVFALINERIVLAVDHKPKSTNDAWRLQRVRNIVREPRVAFLVDAYEDDWTALWWVRADAVARVVDPLADTGDWSEAVDALAERYPQYRSTRPDSLVMSAAVTRWVGWSYS